MAVIHDKLISPHYGGAERQRLRRLIMDKIKKVLEKCTLIAATILVLEMLSIAIIYFWKLLIGAF